MLATVAAVAALSLSPAAASADGALRWTPTQTLAHHGGQTLNITGAVDRRGRALMAWEEVIDGEGEGVLATARRRGGFGAPRRPGGSVRPRWRSRQVAARPSRSTTGARAARRSASAPSPAGSGGRCGCAAATRSATSRSRDVEELVFAAGGGRILAATVHNGPLRATLGNFAP